MNLPILDSTSAVRDTWSDQERLLPKDLATSMQLQLRALVVLSELSHPREEREK